MNVQELIDQLMLIEDKTLPVCGEAYEEFLPHQELNKISIVDDFYVASESHADGLYVLLGEHE